MNVPEILSSVKSLAELGKQLAALIEKAKRTPNVVRQVLLYLESAQGAVHGLGIERQRILMDVERLNIGNASQVEALRERLYAYLHTDVLRTNLDKSISGLKSCQQSIQRESDSALWRKRDKRAAAQMFSHTLVRLESTLQKLSNKFFRGTSGFGLKTLTPILALLTRVGRQQRKGSLKPKSIESIHEKLGELAGDALRDKEHVGWLPLVGKVEGLIAALRLAFSVSVMDAAKGDS